MMSQARRDPGLPGRGGIGIDELVVDAAGKQVRRGDRHDGRGDERADDNGRVADPANQLGNMCSNSSGTDSCALPPPALTPAFTAGGARAM
jgi:hypothetical protein